MTDYDFDHIKSSSASSSAGEVGLDKWMRLYDPSERISMLESMLKVQTGRTRTAEAVLCRCLRALDHGDDQDMRMHVENWRSYRIGAPPLPIPKDRDTLPQSDTESRLAEMSEQITALNLRLAVLEKPKGPVHHPNLAAQWSQGSVSDIVDNC